MSSCKNTLCCRFGNHIIINTVFSILAKKYNLFMEYDYLIDCEKLGIELFCGTNHYNSTIILTDDIAFQLLHFEGNLYSNIVIRNSYYQTKEISNYLFEYYQTDSVKKNIIDKNKFKERYNNNNDVYIHVRLDDAARFNPGYDYYASVLSSIHKYDTIYISSDTIEHTICQKMIKEFNAIPIQYNEVDTMHFGSTCKNVILSHGSFSAIIGYLSFYSSVYYSKYGDIMWHGDIFSIPSWNKI
jgi:hypothetical protein